MRDVPKPPEAIRTSAGRFGVTPWTDVVLAQERASAAAREAIERLCRIYWYPIYAHVRQQGHSPHDAEDLTQEFFALLLEKNYLGAADRRRGRFRSFLLVAVNRFLVNAYERERTLKRGGEQVFVSIDQSAAESRLGAEPTTDLSPDKIFDRRWAQTVLDQTLARLRMEYVQRGHAELFEHLKDFVIEETEYRDYPELGAQLKMKPSTVSVAVHRLRQRFRELLRAEIRPTVANPQHIDAEMRHLVEALTG